MPNPISLKHFFVAALLLCSQLQLRAQAQKVKVEAVADDNSVLANATLQLQTWPDTLLLFNRVMHAQEHVVVENGKAYRMRITHQGFADADSVFTVSPSLSILRLRLRRMIGHLDQVVVVSAKRPLMKEEDDKTVVDASALTTSSTNAFEVVEKTPGAVIDQDGNVYLTSTTPATVFINGKEMKLSGADVASLLKSMPANSVSKIEILRSPSAKFDAASSGGIINIVLKKGVKLGNSGSVNAGYFQGVYATATGGFTYNKNGTHLNSYINYQYTGRTSFEELNSVRQFPSDHTMVDQHSYTRYPYLNHYISAGFDHTLNSKWNWGYDTRFSYNRNHNRANNDINITSALNGGLLSKNNAIINNDNNSTYWFHTLNLKCKIDTSGSEWTSSAEFLFYRYENDQFYRNDYTFPLYRYNSGQGINQNNKRNITAQSDLVIKLPKKYTLETGIKINAGNSENFASYVKDTGNGIILTDRFQTNTYHYDETIGAAYLQLSKTFLGFTFKPGLRLEYTRINGHQLIPGDTSFGIKRTDVFPYLYLKHKLFKMYGQTLMGSAIFRKSIRRPYYESLNPYPRFVDQFLYDVGNPSLRPQFTTTYEFNTTFNDIPVFALGWNITKDIFSNVIYQDNATRIAYRTFDNLGKNKEFFFRLVMGIPPGKKYFFYLGSVYNYNEYRGFYQQQPFNYNRSSYTFFTYHEYKLTRTLTVNLQAFMRTKALQNFYQLRPFGGMFISANRSLMNKKANLIVSLSDVFSTNQVNFTFNRNDQQITGSRINDTRRLGITFRYNFGFKPKEEKKNNFEAPAETKDN